MGARLLGISRSRDGGRSPQVSLKSPKAAAWQWLSVRRQAWCRSHQDSAKTCRPAPPLQLFLPQMPLPGGGTC